MGLMSPLAPKLKVQGTCSVGATHQPTHSTGTRTPPLSPDTNQRLKGLLSSADDDALSDGPSHLASDLEMASVGGLTNGSSEEVETGPTPMDMEAANPDNNSSRDPAIASTSATLSTLTVLPPPQQPEANLAVALATAVAARELSSLALMITMAQLQEDTATTGLNGTNEEKTRMATYTRVMRGLHAVAKIMS